ncbi:MAG: hypothetical protein QG629_311 [Patescibacteria group bacterium]|nr:hypothetical protein [Patescibacteria group bacterium]
MLGKLRRELRFQKSIEAIDRWDENELVAIFTRSGNEGVMFICTSSNAVRCIPFFLTKGFKDSTSGRTKPVICDFCKTWQSGQKAARISFRPNYRSQDSFAHIICADMRCSDHARGKSPESNYSRTQIREDITPEDRILRLNKSLENLTIQFDSYHKK